MYGRFARAKSAWHEALRRLVGVSIESCVPALLCHSTLSLACTLTTDHLRFHFVGAHSGEVLLVTRDMEPASKATHCQNTTYKNKVGQVFKFCSHKQQGSQIVVSGVRADSNSRCR
eukprot:306833-Amphidinium_carterae.1